MIASCDWFLPFCSSGFEKEYKVFLAEIQAIINQSTKPLYPDPGFRPVPVIRDSRDRLRLLSCRMTTRRDMKLERNNVD